MPTKNTTSELLTPREAAAALRISPKTLAGWRLLDGVGPRWAKLGTSPTSPIRYARDELNKFINRSAC
jgi:hypothetical protein